MRAALLGLALVTSLLVAACSAGSEDGQENRSERRAEAGAASERGGAVLYTVGVSTDPYGGGSSPAGFGVVLNLGTPGERMLEIRNPDLGWFGGAEWIDERRILVPRKAPPFRPPSSSGLTASASSARDPRRCRRSTRSRSARLTGR